MSEGGPLDNAMQNLLAANLALDTDALNHLADQVETAAGACAQVGGSVAETSQLLYGAVLKLREAAGIIGNGKMAVQSHIEWLKRLGGSGT